MYLVSSCLHMPIQIPIDDRQIAQFCDRWKITELALFGSVLQENFDRDRSDVDVLVSFAEDARWTLLHLVDMEDELRKIFARDVDLVERQGIEQSRNYLRRKAILSSTHTIYATS